jgi:cytochrome b561
MPTPFQITVDLGIYYERIAVSLGFVTLVTGLATFASCRNFITLISRYTNKNILENKAYQSFYKYHGYYWWTFLVVLVVHMMSSAMHTNLLPGTDDPDAVEHWWILGFALGILVSLFIQAFSCRSFVSLIDFFSQKSPLKFRLYKGFYKFHAYYWWLVFVSVAGHIIASSIHTHIWPT